MSNSVGDPLGYPARPAAGTQESRTAPAWPCYLSGHLRAAALAFSHGANTMWKSFRPIYIGGYIYGLDARP
jgi:hypothetical protein